MQWLTHMTANTQCNG